MRLAFYQPDIPQNLGAAIRLSACLGVGLDVVEPCGFPLTDKALRRSALDYSGLAEVRRHASFGAFRQELDAQGGRLVLIETDGKATLHGASFAENDTLILGRETVGSPPELRAAADLTVRIPMRPGARSLNVAMAAGIALAEALRQTGGFAKWEMGAS